MKRKLLTLFVVVALSFLVGRLLVVALDYTLDQASPYITVWRLLQEDYIGYIGEFPPTPKLVWAAATRGIQGMVDSLDDPHTTFYSVEEVDELYDNLSLAPTSYRSYGGVGIRLTYGDAGNSILEVLEDLPAMEAGLKEGDLIIAVARNAGEWFDIRGLSFYERSILIRGLPGTKVWFRVERAGESRPLIFEAERVFIKDVIDSPVDGYLLSEEVGYLQLYSFESFGLETYSWFRGYLEALLLQGAQALILDLRGDTGGSRTIALLVADELLPQGKAIMHLTKKESGAVVAETIFTQEGRISIADGRFTTGGLAPDIPLVVLINGRTASAAEILVGAIQDHGRGVLVGETTYGKGVGICVSDLPDGSILRVRCGGGETPSGRNIDGVGITPDIIVPMPEESDSTDPQLEKALECALILLEGGECH